MRRRSLGVAAGPADYSEADPQHTIYVLPGTRVCTCDACLWASALSPAIASLVSAGMRVCPCPHGHRCVAPLRSPANTLLASVFALPSNRSRVERSACARWVCAISIDSVLPHTMRRTARHASGWWRERLQQGRHARARDRTLPRPVIMRQRQKKKWGCMGVPHDFVSARSFTYAYAPACGVCV